MLSRFRRLRPPGAVLAVLVLASGLAWGVGARLVARFDGHYVRTAGTLNLQYARTITASLDTAFARDGQAMLARAAMLGQVPAPARSTVLAAMMAGARQLPSLAWLDFADSDGRVVASSAPVFLGEDARTQSWWQAGRQGLAYGDAREVAPASERPAWVRGPASPPPGEPWRVVDVAVPVRDARGTLVGVLAAHVSAAWLQGHIAALSSAMASTGGRLYLIGTDGVVRFGPDDAVGRIDPVGGGTGAGGTATSGFAVETAGNGRRHVTAWTRTQGVPPFPGLGWTTVVRSPEGALEAAFAAHRRQVWGAAASAVCVVTLLAAALHGYVRRMRLHARELAAARAGADRLRRRLDLALDTVALGTWHYEPATDRATWDRRSCAIYGIDEDGPLPSGAQYFERMHPDDRASVRQALDALVAGTASTFAAEFRIPGADGGWTWVQSEGQVTERDADGRPRLLSGVQRDVTEAHEQRLALERANERLREAQKLAEQASAAKSAFLASMSHEIRTPLNGIVGTADLLAATPLDAEQRELVQMQREAAGALLTIVSDVLDLARIESGRIELEAQPFDIAHLVRRTLAMVRPIAERKGVALESTLPAGFDPGVTGDAGRVRQVLLNLVNNAVKFTLRGSVRVTLEERSGDASLRRLRFTVEDTGIGIPADAIERLFEPFEQYDTSTTRRFGGTGLGLPICRQLVQRMGGTIGVDSTVGQGSRFWFELPLARPAPSAGERAAVSTALEARSPLAVADGRPARPPARALNVLMAEDVRTNQVIATRMLARAGHRVTVVENGVDAVDAVARGRFDVVLMNMHMPEMDGLEATRRIRALAAPGARIPIIGLTAEARREELDRCLAAGMDDALTKPFDSDTLLARLQALARPS